MEYILLISMLIAPVGSLLWFIFSIVSNQPENETSNTIEEAQQYSSPPKYRNTRDYNRKTVYTPTELKLKELSAEERKLLESIGIEIPQLKSLKNSRTHKKSRKNAHDNSTVVTNDVESEKTDSPLLKPPANAKKSQPDKSESRDIFRSSAVPSRRLRKNFDSRPSSNHVTAVPASFNYRQRQIKDFIEHRDITSLVHFTQYENLDSIMSSGIVSRSAVDTHQTQAHVNDELRLDGRKDTISVSISFPNYKMFYKYRKQTLTKGWAVIEINPDVLWTLHCLFCSANAASTAIARSSTTQLAEFQSLTDMFSDSDYAPRNQPNDPQAEVLVCEPIPISHILSVHFENHALSQAFKRDHPEIKSVFSNHYFKWKEDAA